MVFLRAARAFAALVLLLPAQAGAQNKPVVTIGVPAALSGSNAHLGESIRDAMILAKENLPADTKFEYRLIFEDDGMEAKRAAAAANKLISIDKADALVSQSSGTSGAISPIAEQNKVIHFSIATARNVGDGDYNFLHCTAPDEDTRVLVDELKRRGIKKLALIILNHPWPLEEREYLKKRLAGTGIELVADEMSNAGERDFKGVIAKAQEKNPDLYLIIFFSPELEILYRQIREAGAKTPVTTILGYSLSSNPSLYEGEWFIDSVEPGQDFYARFNERFEKNPYFGAPNAYDIFNLIVYGYEHTEDPGKPSTAEVIKTLYRINDFPGVLGALSIDKKGTILLPAAVKTIKNGRPVVLETQL